MSFETGKKKAKRKAGSEVGRRKIYTTAE